MVDEESYEAKLRVVGGSIPGDTVLVDPNGSKFTLLSDCSVGSSSPSSPTSGSRSMLRGLTSGALPIRDRTSLAPCFLFGCSSCGWLPVV